ncbi:MAG: hypothetical protein JRN67_03990 [Nitrososphaerota archaeon]|nr:hypothetical protein [Nitrososphaerota archaeon]
MVYLQHDGYREFARPPLLKVVSWVASGLALFLEISDKIHQKVVQEFLVVFTLRDYLFWICISRCTNEAEFSDVDIGCHLGTPRDIVVPPPNLLIFFQ